MRIGTFAATQDNGNGASETMAMALTMDAGTGIETQPGSRASDDADDAETHPGVLLSDIVAVVAASLACIALAVITLSSGGFFGKMPCMAGMALSIVAAITAFLRPGIQNRRIGSVPVAMLGVAAAYVASMLVAGTTLTTVIEVGKWCSYAAFAYVVASVSQRHRDGMFAMVTWFGIVTAIAGFLVAAGLVPMQAGMVGSRLQLTFQYANATAAWFGATGLLAVLSPDSRHRRLAPIPFAAALMTQSIGGLACLTAVVVVASVLACKRGYGDVAYGMLRNIFLAGILAAVCLIWPIASVALLAVFTVAVVCVPELYDSAVGFVQSKVPMAALSVLLVFGIASAGIARMSRVQAAVASLLERTSHAVDGLGVWLSSPVIGIGPDNWQYVYPYHQSAPYQVSVIHSSPVQVLTDVGFVGFVFLVLACAVGLKGLLHKVTRVLRSDDSSIVESDSLPWAMGELCAVTLLVAHAVVDFDFRFGALVMLLTLCLVDGGIALLRERDTTSRSRMLGTVAVAICSVACLVACSLGFSSAMTLDKLRATARTGDAETCLYEAEKAPLARQDQEVLSLCLETLVANGKYGDAVEEFDKMASPKGTDVLAVAFSMRQDGDTERADEIIRLYAERMPYDEDLQETASALGNDGYGKKEGYEKEAI